MIDIEFSVGSCGSRSQFLKQNIHLTNNLHVHTYTRTYKQDSTQLLGINSRKHREVQKVSAEFNNID